MVIFAKNKTVGYTQNLFLHMPDVYNFIFYTFLTGMTPEARVTSRPATGRTRMCWEAGRSSAETRDDGIKL